jgi:hypothetical protein
MDDINFNMRADHFQRVENINDLVVGRVYILCHRIYGDRPVDIIGRYLGQPDEGINYLQKYYTRKVRILGNGNQTQDDWVSDAGKYQFYDIFLNQSVLIFDLGEVGQKINPQNSPDSVAEAERSRRYEVRFTLNQHLGQDKKLPTGNTDIIESYMGPNRGGRRKSKSRRRSKQKKRSNRKKNKSKKKTRN